MVFQQALSQWTSETPAQQAGNRWNGSEAQFTERYDLTVLTKVLTKYVFRSEIFKISMNEALVIGTVCVCVCVLNLN